MSIAEAESETKTELAVDNGGIDLTFGDAQIAVLAESSNGLDLTTAEGYESARQVIRSAKQMRSGVESGRKKLKQFYLEEGRKIDKEAKRLTALIEEFENPLADQKKAIDDAKAEAKRKKQEAAEAERLEAERVERERLESERKAEDERIRKEQEAEQARLDEERRKIEAEREAMRVEREKLQAERDRIENEKLEAERIERERVEAEERAERERLQAIEDEKIEAARVERERLEKIEADKRAEEARLEAERLAEEQKPDREKLATWLQSIRHAIDDEPRCSTEWGREVIEGNSRELVSILDVVVQDNDLSSIPKGGDA